MNIIEGITGSDRLMDAVGVTQKEANARGFKDRTNDTGDIKLGTGEWKDGVDSNNKAVPAPTLSQRTQKYTYPFGSTAPTALKENNVYSFDKGCWIYTPKPCMRPNLSDPTGTPWPGFHTPDNTTVSQMMASGKGTWLHDTWNHAGKKAYANADECKARSLAFNPDSTWCTASSRNPSGGDKVSYHFNAPELCAPGQACAKIPGSQTQWNPPNQHTYVPLSESNPRCDDWKWCADEHGNCSGFPGTKDIVFGDMPVKGSGSAPQPKSGPRRYKIFKNKQSNALCSNSVDGDPAPGTVKACYYCPSPEDNPYILQASKKTGCYLWTDNFDNHCKVFGDDWVLDKTQGYQGKEQGICRWTEGQGICKRN
jgi:hypothetical protein